LRFIFAFEPRDRFIESGVFAGDVGFRHGRLDRTQLTDQGFAGAVVNGAPGRRRGPVRQVRQGLGEKRVIVSHSRFRSIPSKPPALEPARAPSA
jgi:hypothetical protein